MKTRIALNVLYIVGDDNDSHRDDGTECALHSTCILVDRLSLTLILLMWKIW